jgi:hypothetical protein
MFSARRRLGNTTFQATHLLCVWVLRTNASVSAKGGSCLLGGRVDASLSPILWLSFADPSASVTGAEVGIEVRGVVERAAGNLHHVWHAHAKFRLSTDLRTRALCAAVLISDAALPQMEVPWGSKGLANRDTHAIILKRANFLTPSPACSQPHCRGAGCRRKWMAA